MPRDLSPEPTLTACPAGARSSARARNRAAERDDVLRRALTGGLDLPELSLERWLDRLEARR